MDNKIFFLMKLIHFLRICDDYRALLNAHAKNDKCPLPRNKELSSRLSSFITFNFKDSKLQQLIDEKTTETLNIRPRLSYFHWLHFRVKIAAGNFKIKLVTVKIKVQWKGMIL